MTNSLPLWKDGAASSAILNFVDDVTRAGSPRFVPLEQRIAVFDNDGTLWCEKPMPIELIFILQKLAAMAQRDESLRTRQPWQAAFTRDYSWLGNVITKHYLGDDSDIGTLMKGILSAFADMTMEEYQAQAGAFLFNGVHPTLQRVFRDCGYTPMISLLRYLEEHGFTVFIASGGDRDFMRTISREVYGIPPERVIGSSNALRYREDEGGGSIVYLEKPDVFDDGPAKPVRIWSRIGQRPLLAVGNSNGDIQMLQFTEQTGRPSLGMLVLHDDKAREFDYTAGAERALEMAKSRGWIVASIRNDWTSVFKDGKTEAAPAK